MLGVDDDMTACELSRPTLSSVTLDAFEAGRLAAELIDRALVRKSTRQELHSVKPLGISARQSTDAVAVEDAGGGIGHTIHSSSCKQRHWRARRSGRGKHFAALERKFQRLLRRTPYQEILRCRIALSKTLLADTELPLKTIAQQCGLGNEQHFSTAFSGALGERPGAYRKRIRHTKPTTDPLP